VSEHQIPRPAPPRRTAGWLLFAAVVLIAINLRMTITAVGPLLDQIGDDEGLSPAVLGLLSSVPLLSWAAFSPFSHWVGSRLGMTSAVSWALVALALGTLLRSLTGSHVNLWAGTALIGLGLAVTNVLMPAVIKREFPTRVPLLMGVYTAALSAMAALAAGIAVPLSALPLDSGEPAGWRFALIMMGAPIPLAIAVWLIATRGRRRLAAPRPGEGAILAAEPLAGLAAESFSPTDESRPPAGRRIWRDSLAWQVSLYMGSQSVVFYTISGWFASSQIAHGLSATAAGAQIMMYQLIGIGGSLLLPLLARDLRVRRWLPALIPAFGLIAWVGIPLAPAAMPLWIVMAGLTAGASLTISLTLMAMRSRTSEQASALSGMAQAVGYLVAAAGPLLFGVLLGATGNWILPFSIIWLTGIAQLLLGVSVGRPRFVLER